LSARARLLLGWALIAYGIAGLALIAGGSVIGLDVATRVERLATSADDTIVAAARSTRAAADAFTNVDASLSESQTSADAAADLARDASVTLSSLGQAMELSIFGAQPLLPLAAEFDTSSGQAAALAETLDRVGSSLADTRPDVNRIAVELDALSDELESLRGAGNSDATTPPLRPFVILLLAWLLVPAAGAIIGGIAVLRWAPVPDRAS